MLTTKSLERLFDSLILFRPGKHELVSQVARAFFEGKDAAKAAARLVREAVERGWEGNLWHCCLAHSLIAAENPATLTWERREAARDSLWELALRDMEVYRRLFDFQPEDTAFALLTDFRCTAGKESAEKALAMTLAQAETPEEMLEALTGYYAAHGAGMLGLGELFRVEESDGRARLFPVENRRGVKLSDLVGYEEQKKQLLSNTLAFLAGHSANNVLLYGDAGTGKSTSVQAIANEYAPRGLRVVELYKRQFFLIPDLLNQLKGRNYRFILFLDDLSFEEDEVEYKHLKAVMEGGAEAAPENVLLYATSNRRHLVRETWRDRNDMEHNGDIHRSDTVEEKLSLAGRFGIQIYYPNPTFEEYQAIVRALAEEEPELAGLSPEQLRTLAATWQVRRGSRSGRTARQFVNDLLCRDMENR